MIRSKARALGATALMALLVVAAVACSGSEGSESTGSTSTTGQVSTATTNARLGDLSDLDGTADGLSGGELDCYNVSLAFVALALAPANALEGGGQDATDQIQADIETLRSQVPSEIVADFDVYAAGVQEYADTLRRPRPLDDHRCRHPAEARAGGGDPREPRGHDRPGEHRVLLPLHLPGGRPDRHDPLLSPVSAREWSGGARGPVSRRRDARTARWRRPVRPHRRPGG